MTSAFRFSDSKAQNILALPVTGAMRVWRWADGKPLRQMAFVKSAGAAALQLESHD